MRKIFSRNYFALKQMDPYMIEQLSRAVFNPPIRFYNLLAESNAIDFCMYYLILVKEGVLFFKFFLGADIGKGRPRGIASTGNGC